MFASVFIFIIIIIIIFIFILAQRAAAKDTKTYPETTQIYYWI